MKLKFFAKGKLGHFYEVNDFSAVGFYDFVADWQCLQVLVYYGVFVFGSEDFEGLVREGSSLQGFVRVNGARLPFLNLP